MKLRIFKKGFNYSQDGPGNRLVYHLQGCNLHCPWCANPESMDLGGALMVEREWLVDSVCPFGAIRQKSLERSICLSCKSKPCINVNKNKGIRSSCEEMEIEEVMKEVIQSSALFYEGGGITLTGGEPMLQLEAIKVLLVGVKEAGIHTAMETNATHPRLEELFPLVDMLIMDFKHYDNERHLAVTGAGNSLIKENIKKAFKIHKNILIRIPLVKGFNASAKDVEIFLAFFRECNIGNASFEFLPYHEYGRIKWDQCGMPYIMKNAFVEGEAVSLFEKTFENNNISVIHT